jgi:hypothetical protein
MNGEILKVSLEVSMTKLAGSVWAPAENKRTCQSNAQVTTALDLFMESPRCPITYKIAILKPNAGGNSHILSE